MRTEHVTTKRPARQRKFRENSAVPKFGTVFGKFLDSDFKSRLIVTLIPPVSITVAGAIPSTFRLRKVAAGCHIHGSAEKMNTISDSGGA